MLAELKRRVYEANMELSERGLVVYTFGNASEIDRERGIVAIKPSGVEYTTLSPEQIVLVDLDGKRVEGDLNPSSDTKTHCKLYREWKKIGGIVHTHSRYATAWAQAKRPLSCFGTTHADYFYGEVPCTEVIGDMAIAKDYEEETGVQIVNAFSGIDYRFIKAVLVACHGPFVWGTDAAEAVYLSVMLEEVAMTGFFTALLDPESKGIKQSLLDKHYLRKHGKDSYYGQSEES
jgi:L-ribulose-5-phosphate 4-epimerase